MTVLLPAWRKVADQNATALEGIALKDLHRALKLDAFARKLNLLQIVTPWNAIRQYASTVVGSALACALYDAGWKIETEPGVLWLTRDAVRLNPFQVVNGIASGELQEQEWNETIPSSGLDPSMPLAPPRRLSEDSHLNGDGAGHAVPACPSCGTLYNLADYRADAPRIYCSSCHAELPRFEMDEEI